MMNKVDFFIVGAPKSGTSALHQYLRLTDGVFLPEEKELYYFDKDLTYRRSKRSKEEYWDLFSESAGQLCGDATATYLRSEKAAKEIRNHNPDAKIIVILRDPVEMMYSLHSELFYNGDEVIESFEEALDILPSDRTHDQLSMQMFCPMECLNYRKMAIYTEQLDRYYAAFPQDQILVIPFYELKKDTKAVYLQVLSFLGIEASDLPDLNPVNVNKKTKNRHLRNFLRDVPEVVKKTSRVLIPSKKLRKKMFHGMNEMNSVRVQREKMSAELRERLTGEYNGEVLKLERLLKWNLNAWKK